MSFDDSVIVTEIVTVIKSPKRGLEKQIASLTVSKKFGKISTLAYL